MLFFNTSGCILYELCTLQHAFQADNINALMQKIVSVDYPPLVNSSSTSYTTSELAANVSTSSSAAPTLSPTKMLSPPIYSSRLSNLIQLLLSKNPRDRPTVNEILNIPWLKSRIPKWLSKRRIIEEVGLCKYTILIGDVAV